MNIRRRTSLRIGLFLSLSTLCSAMTPARQVLRSRTDTSCNNYCIPMLILTEKGTVLAFAEGREAGDSGDNDGLSWSEPVSKTLIRPWYLRLLFPKN